MKKGISVLLVSILVLGLFTACGKALDVDTNTVYVQKKGKITGATIEKFDKDYYEAEEFEQYVNEAVETYNAAHDEKSIELDKFSVEDGEVTLLINYAGYEDYLDFNGVKMFVGTVPQAMAAGYEFEGEFTAVEKGEAKGTVSGKEVSDNSELKVVVLNEKVNVKVDGTILYVSSDYTSIEGKDTVSIRLPEDARDGEELAMTYIVYK